MITILFESHSTTYDNEQHKASGWNDIDLSRLGVEQAKDLGTRRGKEPFDAVFCSDFQRSYKTAQLAFGDTFPIVQDARLRECNYGDMTQHPSEEVDAEKPKRINEPFPNGESYMQTLLRMKSFLEDLLQKYQGKRIMIIGHRATQYGLEHWLKGIPLEQIILAHWEWQPGWEYKLEKI